MAVSHTLVVAAVLSSLLVCGRADLCAPDCGDGSNFFPHPQDCNSFYRCSHGTAFLLHCPEGLVFVYPGQTCESPAPGRCKSDPARECGVSTPPQKPGLTGSTVSHHGSTLSSLESTVSSLFTSVGLADLCAPDCRGGSDFFPHPQDCNSYYQCSSGTAVLQHCPEGLEFSFPGLRCDYPAQAGCTSDPARECEVATTSQESDTTETAPNTPTCAPMCRFSGVYLAHPQDCSKFYICGGDGPVEFRCQQGLLYNNEERRCDYPDTFNCTAGPHRACDELL